jgi:hypothetical protein
MGRRLGLIIGVNKYQDTAFRPLKFAETDARALAQWLVNAQGGKWVPPDVQLVLGAQATGELVESLIMEMCGNIAGPDDLVLIYFAGHAFLDEIKGEGYLALANTYYQQPTTGLNLLALAQHALGKSRASKVLVILDCFQTGEVWTMRRSSLYDSKPLLGPTLLNALQQSNGRMFLCSCRGNELASEVGERNLGLLAHRIIVGLSGSASDPITGQVTLQHLHTFLFSALGEQQRPQLFGQGQFVLVGDMSSAAPVASLFHDDQDFRSITSSRLVAQTVQKAAVTGQTQQAPARPPEQYSFTAVQQRRPQQSALLQQAQQLAQMQLPVEAYKLVEHVLESEPNNVDALILKAQLLGMSDRLQEALTAVEQVIRLERKNALAWSMRAAILANMGQFLDALPAVERALELDSTNTETHDIKASIMAHLTPAGGIGESQSLRAVRRRGGPLSFFIGFCMQLLGLAVGITGAGLLILQPGIPVFVGLALESLGLAMLCVNSARGSFLYGAARFLLTLFTSIVVAGLIGGLYKFGYQRLVQAVIAHPSLLGPVLFAVLWLGVAAALPLMLAFGGFIGGVAFGIRRRRRR